MSETTHTTAQQGKALYISLVTIEGTNKVQVSSTPNDVDPGSCNAFYVDMPSTQGVPLAHALSLVQEILANGGANVIKE